MVFKFPSLQDIVVGFVFAIFAIQILSLLTTSIFPSIGLIKGGPAILLMLAAVTIVTLFVLSINLNELKRRETLVFVVIILALTIAAYLYLPDTFPQIFSIDPSTSEAIQETVGSIMGGLR